MIGHHNPLLNGAGSRDDLIEIDSDCEIVNEELEEVIGMETSDNSDRSDVEVQTREDFTKDVSNSNTPGLITPIPMATDFKNLGKRLMKPVQDYPVKDCTHYVWTIEDWNAIKRENKVASPAFECGGFKWNILLFPKGNNDSLSLYMEPHPCPDSDGKLDPNWYICAQFALDIWNPDHPESHYPSGSSHRFNKNETDWGFSSFITTRDLVNPQKVNQLHAIMENNKLNITGYVRVIDDSSTGVLWHNFINYDSKLSTGFVGLNNQGATCYLNSLLQSYFTTRGFRDLVYQIPTSDSLSETSKANSKAVAVALQKIFSLMQSSKEPVGTLELTKSFGWDSSEAFTQHDVQELNRVLMDKLESAMKGTKIENRLNDIFVGKMKSYIKCVNVSYESSRVEDFWDIQLNVKGFQNLQQSFENYIEIEMLDGENKYQAGEGHGYQDAKKGVVFESFPPVLHLQLKRFEYDFMVDDLVKIDDFYEFPDSIDLSAYLDDDLDDSIKNENWNYKLHGVLVHQGSISNGHYYAMIKPEGNSDTWLRFDDDRVWKVTPSQVFKENFGAADLTANQVRQLTRMEQNEYLIRRATSAYMLVYYRESELPMILPDEVGAIPEHIFQQIEAERLEIEKQERLRREALYFINVKIVTSQNFTYFNGFDLCPDPSKTKEYGPEIFDARSYGSEILVRKDAKFLSLLKLLSDKLGYSDPTDSDGMDSSEDYSVHDADFDVSALPFKLLTIKQRNNKTSRPDCGVPPELFDETVMEVYNKCFKRKYDEMAFFVLETREELTNITAPKFLIQPELFNFDEVSERIVSQRLVQVVKEDTGNEIILFIKYFDPVLSEVRGLTFLTVNKDVIISNLTPKINSLLGFHTETSLSYFEEISRMKIEPVDPKLTLEKNELSTGDILAVQLSEVQSVGGRISGVQDYYKFLFTRLHIHVKPCKVNDGEEDSDYVAEEDAVSEKETSVDINGESAEAKDIKLAKEISKSFDMWVSTTHTYQELAEAIAKRIGDKTDPDYLRIFVINNHGTRFPLASNMSLSQIFNRQVAVSSVSEFEYEVLNITLKEYESMKAIKIYWLNSVLQFHLLELLVPRTSTVADLVSKVVHKLNIPQHQLSGILVWASEENKYADLIKFDRSIEDISDNYEILCGYFPTEVEILVRHDMFKRYQGTETDGSDIEDKVTREEFKKAQLYSKSLNIIPVFHFQKSTTYTHSKPFVFAAFPDEPFEETKERLRVKLGLGQQAFEKIRVALADANDKGKYLETERAGFNLLEEIASFDSHVSLALDHRDRNTKRSNTQDKGISIG